MAADLSTYAWKEIFRYEAFSLDNQIFKQGRVFIEVIELFLQF